MAIHPIVYFLQRADGHIKIGTTTGYTVRLYELEREHGPLILLGWQYGNRIQERELHERFADTHIGGEWFVQSPALLDYIQSVAETGEPPKLTRSKRQAEILWLKEISKVEAVITEMQATVQQQARTIQALQAQHYQDTAVIQSLEREVAHSMNLVRQTAFELGQVERQYQNQIAKVLADCGLQGQS